MFSGQISPREWVFTSQKGNMIYIHVLNRVNDLIFLQGMHINIAFVVRYNTDEKLRYLVDEYGFVIVLPDKYREDINLIVEIRFK